MSSVTDAGGWDHEEYSLKEFQRYVEDGCFNDYDGQACVMRGDKETPTSISKIMRYTANPNMIIRWYPK